VIVSSYRSTCGFILSILSLELMELDASVKSVLQPFDQKLITCYLVNFGNWKLLEPASILFLQHSSFYLQYHLFCTKTNFDEVLINLEKVLKSLVYS
jgi:hypothetical protein